MRFLRKPAHVAWDAVTAICRHRRRWDTEVTYRDKMSKEGAYRCLPGVGKVHGGTWAPLSEWDTPESHGRAVEMDNKSIDLSRAADLMISWGKQTAPLRTTEQARRTSEIYKILRLHYPDEANDPVCSPALRVSAGEAKSGSVGCLDSWSPSLAQRPSTNSDNKQQQQAQPARTPHSLPVNSIHRGTIATLSLIHI